MGNPLCVVRSDDMGSFVFRNVPGGMYQIVPFYRSVHTTFDVAPNRQEVEVGQGNVSVLRFHVVSCMVSFIKLLLFIRRCVLEGDIQSDRLLGGWSSG